VVCGQNPEEAPGAGSLGVSRQDLHAQGVSRLIGLIGDQLLGLGQTFGDLR
jgi:hypothetical protein